jgi:pimeloyl-ACP methyl ester carboxylesterase
MAYIKSNEGYKIFFNYYNLNSIKTPIIFVHGWLSDSSCFKKYYKFFKEKNYPYLYLDIRGYGESENVLNEKDFTFEKIVDDINKILLHLNIKKIILFGYSMGGMISILFNHKYPDKVEKLLLFNTSYKYPRKVKFLNFTLPLSQKLEKKTNSLFNNYFNSEENFIDNLFKDKKFMSYHIKNYSLRNVMYGINEIARFNMKKEFFKINKEIFLFLNEDDLFFNYNLIKKNCKNKKNIKLIITKGKHNDLFIHIQIYLNYLELIF